MGRQDDAPRWYLGRTCRRSCELCGEPAARASSVSEEWHNRPGFGLDQVRLAVNFYSAYPEEIDARIAADETAADQIRVMVRRREHLLSG
jgi:hypothetical protein